MVKDYYKILEIIPTANSTEIKAAYRRLALQFHPDKNPGDKYALSQFYLVKEAYETLSSRSLKEEYLKLRWLSKVKNEKLDSTSNTPETILHQFLEAGKKIQQYDAFRVDKKGIEGEILSLLNANNISLLNDFSELPVNEEIIRLAIQISNVLAPSGREKIFSELRKIKGGQHAVQLINRAEKENKLHSIFNQLTPWLIAIAVLFLCGLIFIVGRI